MQSLICWNWTDLTHIVEKGQKNECRLYELPAEHISSYLQLSGWQLVNQNERCYVFEGFEDVDDNPFEIVLP